MKLFLPKQHGAWAMIIVPFWLGVIASSFVWQHIPFFIGWVLLYLATYPLLLSLRSRKRGFHLRWALIYFVPALLLLLIPLFKEPKIIYVAIAMIPLFLINAYFSKTNNERALLNDFSAILSFSLVILAVAYMSEQTINDNVLLVFIASIVFFVCATFYVKSKIRERKNLNYKYISWGFHFLAVIGFALAGHIFMAVSLIPALIRAVYLYYRNITIMQLGIIEIVNAVWFFIFMTIAVLI